MTTNILNADVSITGLRPLLINHFGVDCLPLIKIERKGVAGNNPEEWKKTVLYDEKKQLYLEPSYIFACIRDGAKYTKKGRGSLQSAVAATLQVADDKIYLDRYLPDDITADPTQPVYLDIRSVKNPGTKSRNIRYRVAASKDWHATFNITWDKTIVSRDQIHAIIIDAGMYCGLGDGRSIGFGRFVVDKFEVLSNA
ncbi:MAG: hypothetical protein ACOX3L_14555 [Lutisporaceae bacterium]